MPTRYSSRMSPEEAMMDQGPLSFWHGSDCRVALRPSDRRAVVIARSLTRRGSQRQPMAARKTRAPLLCAKCRKETLALPQGRSRRLL